MGSFSYHSLEDLKTDIDKFHLDLRISQNIQKLFERIKISGHGGKLSIPNRIGIHPMEGFDSDQNGNPTSLTHERYKRFGSSGAGIVWFEATAVVPEGRSNPHQLMITQDNIDGFKDIIKNFNKARMQFLDQLDESSKKLFQNPIKILQLTHSGRYSKPKKDRYPYRVTNLPELDSAMQIPPENGEIVSDQYLDELKEKYLNCVEYADIAGFDGVDIKSCHGYLISELLGSYNRENSRYGGDSIEKRSRFLLDIIRMISQQYPKMIITVRINLFDALPYPNGFNTKDLDDKKCPQTIDLHDLHTVLKGLQSYGVKLVSFSAGNPYYKPYLSRPFVQNAFNGPDSPEHPLISIERIVHCLREVKENHPELITIGTAFSWLRQFGPCIATGEIQRNSFDIMGFGRMAFAYPKFPFDIFQTGILNPKKTCIACSKCTEMMRMGGPTGCAVRDPKYSQIYREAYREYKKKKELP